MAHETKPVSGEFTIRRIGGYWRVLNPAGKIVGGCFPSRDNAETARDRHQAEADCAAKRMKRSCMCCQREFQSVGIHNRLCDQCRRRGGEMDRPNSFSFAQANGKRRSA